MKFKYIVAFIYLSVNLGCSQSNFWNSAPKIENIKSLTALSHTVDESSGVIQYKDKIWTINDSGDSPIIYQISPVTGKVLKKIELLNAKNKDWEILSCDSTYLYIGDTGNNSRTRTKFRFYKISLEKLDQAKDTISSFEKISYSYPKDHPTYDSEAMIPMGDELWIFTKNRASLNTTLFSVPKTAGNHVAKYLWDFDSKGLITSASYSKKRLVLLGYKEAGNHQPFLWVFNNVDEKSIFKKTPKAYLLPMRLQFEAIHQVDENKYILTNEGSKKKRSMLWELNLN